MEYICPDAQAVLTAQEACKAAAQFGDWKQLSTAVTGYLDLYDTFYTMYNLSTIHYRLDLSNSDWAEEFNYCSEQEAFVDSDHQRLGYALTATEYVEQLERSEYFGENGLLYYKGENYLTPEVETLLQEEARLQNQYYALSEGASPTSGGPLDALGELLVQLVKVRKKIATAAGFDNYADFAYVFINPMSGFSVPVTFAHEFGHFCDGSVSNGRMANVDTAEVYSQAMEYMSLFYADGTQNDAEIYSQLQCYVISAAQADFELRLYELEVQEPGAGLRCYEEILASEQVQILSLLEEADLRSPFEPGFIEKTRDTFQKMLEK